MSSVNFEVKTDLTTLNPNRIETNFPAVREWLVRELEPYKTMVVTEDAISSAKTFRANIRKVKDGINAQKIAVTKQWNKPLDDFTAQVKELMSLCDEAANNIDTQVKGFENQIKAQKLDRLKAHFESVSYLVKDYVRWEDIVDKKWENATFKEETAKFSIDEIVRIIGDDVRTIKEMGSEFETSMLDEYAHTHDIRKALQKEKDLKERRMTENRNFEQERENIYATPQNPSQPRCEPQSDTQEETTKPKKLYKLRFECVMDIEQANALKAFFTEHNIKYTKIA